MTRHDTDVVSLVAGLCFLAIAGVWALDRTNLVSVDARWLLPALLVGIGAAGLAAALRPRRDRSPEPDAQPAYPGPWSSPPETPSDNPTQVLDVPAEGPSDAPPSASGKPR